MTGYRLSVGTAPETFDLLVDLEVGNVTQVQSQPDLPLGTVFYGTVAAVNRAGPGPRAPAIRVGVTRPGPTPTPRPTPGVSLDLLASPARLRAGERLTVRLRAMPPATAVDLYAAILLPEGSGVLFFTGQVFRPFSPEPAPYRRGLSGGPTEFELFSAVLDPSVPPGRYALRAAFIVSGQPPSLGNVVGEFVSAEVEIVR